MGSCHYSRFRSKQVRGMAIRTVEHLIEETGIGYEEIATKSGLPVARVAAIAEGAGRRAPMSGNASPRPSAWR